MISSFSNSSDSPLLAALVDFCSLVLRGDIPEEVRPFFFGASLVALRKKQGGVRPIAVGCTLRRLVAKVAGKLMSSEMADLLSPRQLGYGIRGGAEAAVHAARCYLSSMPSDQGLVKLDFKNAFNSTRRDRMLEATLSFAPDIFPLVYSAYSAPSHLFWGDRLLSSAEGVQQGDPLGPLLFCLTLFPLSQRLSSRFCICYLDDVSIGGSCDTILSDLKLVEEAESLGLVLNTHKSEIISCDPSVCGRLSSSLPGALVIDPSQATLLGSPLGDIDCVSAAIQDKVSALQRMSDRLVFLSAHDALLLLRCSLSIPKLLYLLRTAPCFASDSLKEYDSVLASSLSSITNTSIDSSSAAWLQASLPISLGGLGIRSAVEVAPSAFLASAHSSSALVQSIPSSSHSILSSSLISNALTLWSSDHDSHPPTDDEAFLQKAWDRPRAESVSKRLLDNASCTADRARLLAASCREPRCLVACLANLKSWPSA